jgi:hypothetical protein
MALVKPLKLIVLLVLCVLVLRLFMLLCCSFRVLRNRRRSDENSEGKTPKIKEGGLRTGLDPVLWFSVSSLLFLLRSKCR